MKKNAWALVALVLPLTLTACSDQPDRVLFVTDTGIGMGYDTTPPNISIDYHRFEGYIAPTYENGALPPVVARIQSNLNVFSPKISQVYATGEAAKDLTLPVSTTPGDAPLYGSTKKVGYFATDSSFGLQVSYTGTTGVAPSAINLGYKRKEFSLIPVSTMQPGVNCDLTKQPQAAQDAIKGQFKAEFLSINPNATDEEQNKAVDEKMRVDCYGSTLASINIGGQIGQTSSTETQLDQFFATGTAARNLAATGGPVRTQFLASLVPADTGKTGLVATLGSTSISSAASVPLDIYVTAINDDPVTVALTGFATISDVKVGGSPRGSAGTTTVVLHKNDLVPGNTLTVTFDLNNPPAGSLMMVTWTGSAAGATATQIGGPITVK